MRVLGAVAVLLIVGAVALGTSFSAERLPVPDDVVVKIPAAQPPAPMRISLLDTGSMTSYGALMFRGGDFRQKRAFDMTSVLIEHPKGDLLIDAGFGTHLQSDLASLPWIARKTSQVHAGTPILEQFQRAGFKSDRLAIVLTHAHWDHIGGAEDLPQVPVWVTQPELDFIHSGHIAARLAGALKLNYHVYDFPGGEYLGFPRSFDVFGDGSVVIVPAPGHTPGAVIVFVNLPSGKRYAFIGDTAWQHEGVDIPAQRPWLARKASDFDEAGVRHWLVLLHLLKAQVPGLQIMPSHDTEVMHTLPLFPDRGA